MTRTRPPLKAKRDVNEPDIVDTLIGHGFSVYKMDTPVDLLVGYSGRTWIIEIKTPKGGKLSKAQVKFYDEWRGNRTILRTVEAADDWCRSMRFMVPVDNKDVLV